MQNTSKREALVSGVFEFARLPVDIQHDILAAILDTSPKTLPSLARVSRSLNGIVTPYIYRNIVLSYHTSEQPAQALLWSQLSKEDGVSDARHVRRLRVERIQYDTVLLSILDKMENLRALEWHIDTRMLKAALAKLSPANLEEFSIVQRGYIHPGYRFDEEQCELLQSRMNRFRMRKLDLHTLQTCPINLFQVLIGHTPRLKSLGFRFPNQREPADVIYQYVESIDGLESLDVANANGYLPELWPVLGKHQHTLKRLTIRPTIREYSPPLCPGLEALRPLALNFPNLEHVGIPVSFQDLELASGAEAMLQNAYMSLLTNLTLHTLALFIHLPGDANKFMEGYIPAASTILLSPIPPLNVASAGRITTQIADGISEYQEQRGDQPLQTLHIHFSLRGNGGGTNLLGLRAELILDRNVKDDAKMLGDEKWEISGKHEWSQHFIVC